MTGGGVWGAASLGLPTHVHVRRVAAAADVDDKRDGGDLYGSSSAGRLRHRHLTSVDERGGMESKPSRRLGGVEV